MSKKEGVLPKGLFSRLVNNLFFLREKEGDDDGTNGPSWKYRRKLIYGAYRLGFAMIIFGGITFLNDMYGVGVALVTGGVSLISIILTAYTASATFEDAKMWGAPKRDKQ
jgi:hypothetical protein